MDFMTVRRDYTRCFEDVLTVFINDLMTTYSNDDAKHWGRTVREWCRNYKCATAFAWMLARTRFDSVRDVKILSHREKIRCMASINLGLCGC